MRHIAALAGDKVPRNEEFNFLARAQALVDRWHDILNHNKPKNGAGRAKTENGDGTEVDKGAMDVDMAGWVNVSCAGDDVRGLNMVFALFYVLTSILCYSRPGAEDPPCDFSHRVQRPIHITLSGLFMSHCRSADVICLLWNTYRTYVM